MYTISSQAVIGGDLATTWAVSSDVAGWPRWDPHEEAARLDGPFVPGATGWSKPHGGPATEWTVVAVEEPYRWSTRCALPGGGMVGETTFAEATPGRVRCAKSIRVSGPLEILFRVWFGRRIRADLARTWAALEREVARRGPV